MRAILKFGLLVLLCTTIFVGALLVTPLVYQILAKAPAPPSALAPAIVRRTAPAPAHVAPTPTTAPTQPALTKLLMPTITPTPAPSALPQPTPVPARHSNIPDGWVAYAVANAGARIAYPPQWNLDSEWTDGIELSQGAAFLSIGVYRQAPGEVSPAYPNELIQTITEAVLDGVDPDTVHFANQGTSITETGLRCAFIRYAEIEAETGAPTGIANVYCGLDGVGDVSIIYSLISADVVPDAAISLLYRIADTVDFN